jgi:3-methyladenine DNA glycosylase/8-oxoguanine DNA glycosylase
MLYEEAEKFLSKQSEEWSMLIQEIGPCRLKISNELLPHQSIIKSIFFQQLHPKAASTIYQRFLDLFNDVFPTDQDIIKNKDLLSSTGLSNRKAQTILSIADGYLKESIPSKKKIRMLNDKEIIEQYTQIKGVGVWTVQMMLIFNQGRSDIMPSSDLAIRKKFSLRTQREYLITPTQLMKETEYLSPYRTIAAWYLWQIK